MSEEYVQQMLELLRKVLKINSKVSRKVFTLHSETAIVA